MVRQRRGHHRDRHLAVHGADTDTHYHGRAGTATDQAHIESFFSRLKGDRPHFTGIPDPAAPGAEINRIRVDYTTGRLHAAIGYLAPDGSHRGPGIRRVLAGAMRRARAEGIKQHRASRT
jgi:transposase InsO family protein